MCLRVARCKSCSKISICSCLLPAPSMLPAGAGWPCGGRRYLVWASIPVSNVVAHTGVVITEQKAVLKAKDLEYLPKSPAIVFVWALWRSLACKPGLCPQVNSRTAIFPGLSRTFWTNRTLPSPVRQWHKKPILGWRLCVLCPVWAGRGVCVPVLFALSPPAFACRWPLGGFASMTPHGRSPPLPEPPAPRGKGAVRFALVSSSACHV